MNTLIARSQSLSWDLEAWAILNNHYHFISKAPENAGTLSKLVRQMHSLTAIELNRMDNTPGQQVWYNYWDTCLTYEKSYLARLHYVHMNSVKHSLVCNPMEYPFCSYKWFAEQGSKELKKEVFDQPIDRIKVYDDF